jgi:putative peptidoglycan lipid II flippase
VRIAVAVLIITQLFNLAFVPYLAHAGLALSIGLGALVNAAWLLWDLVKNGTYVMSAGWLRFVLQVLAACAVLGAWLWWSAQYWNWIALHAEPLLRAGLMTTVLAVSALLYFGVLALTGLKLRALLVHLIGIVCGASLGQSSWITSAQSRCFNSSGQSLVAQG